MSYIFLRPLRLLTKMNYLKVPHTFRTFTASKIVSGNYEGDGKTTVTLLSREHTHLIMVKTFSLNGFRLNNGIFAMGALVAFPRTLFQWNVHSVEDITPESLSLFSLIEPKLDLLIIGTGETKMALNKNASQYLKSHRIVVEILPTYQACSIFNFLNSEGRFVAGAFIPPAAITMYEEETNLVERVTGEIQDYLSKER